MELQLLVSNQIFLIIVPVLIFIGVEGRSHTRSPRRRKEAHTRFLDLGPVFCHVCSCTGHASPRQIWFCQPHAHQHLILQNITDQQKFSQQKQSAAILF